MLLPLLLVGLAPEASASSHREAPAIAQDPAADLTDFYMFLDPNDSTQVVLVLNSWPLELPNGGPNFYQFDDNVLYEIHIDNEGDGVADVVFQFQTQTTVNIPDTFLYNDGYVYNSPHTSIDSGDDTNLEQTYTLTRMDDGVTTWSASGEVAPANVGERSVVAGGYTPTSTSPGTITLSHTYESAGIMYFAGPRQDDFPVDLGHTFDLLGVGVGTNTNSLLGYNCLSIAIELPANSLTKDGLVPSAANQNDVIAAWTTASRRAVSVRRQDGADTAYRGDWVQVSRLGNPLVNEAVIPVGAKDTFNASDPVDDLQFLSYVTDPLLPVYMNFVLGTYLPTDADADLGLGIGGREDLVLAFLTGYSGFGTMPSGYSLGGPIPGESGKTFGAFEALRLNIAGTGYAQWPDGRNVTDDVVDTALFALAGGVLGLSGAVSDGVGYDGLSPLTEFPFLGDPWAGGTY